MSSAISDPLKHSATRRERHRRLAEILDGLSAEALLVCGRSSRDADLAALVGPVHLGEAFVLAIAGGETRLAYTTEMERDEAVASGFELLTPDDLGLAELRRQQQPGDSMLGGLWLRALQSLGIEPARLALAGTGPAGEVATATRHLAAAGWEVVAADRALQGLRKRKTAWEVGEVRRAAAGVCAAFRAVAGLLAEATIEGGLLVAGGEALTAGDLRRAIDAELGVRALGQPEGNIVAVGADSGVPHTQGDCGRRLEAGQPIVVDLYPKGHLFADCTRTFCVGPVPTRLGKAHELVDRALRRATRAAMPGAFGADLQAATCDLFEAAGFATPRSHPGATTGYVHGLGHGVGFELHELPSFRPGSAAMGTLEIGDVLTLEPGLYDPDAGYGVRLEDLFVVREDGTECLTPLPYALDPAEW